MNHREKVKAARRLRTREELKRGISIFNTKAWTEQKGAIQQRVLCQEANAKEASRLRKEVYAR